MDLFSLSLLLLIIILSVISLYLYYYQYQLNVPQLSHQIGFKNYPLLGAIPGFLRNRHKFLQWTTEMLRYSPTNTAVFFRPHNFYGVITANPLNVEHMLKTNFENYPKGDQFISLLDDFLGRGIFNSDGELWHVQRKTASYEFNTKSLRNFILQNVVVEIKTRLVPVLEKASELGQVLDIQDVLERFAFDNVCKLAFNVDMGCLGSVGEGAVIGTHFMAAFQEAATLSCDRFFYVFPPLLKIKKFLSIGSERRLKTAVFAVHKFADNIIRSRLESKKEEIGEEDLLSRFIENDDNSPEYLRDIVISFILAGRDTTSSALTWFFWLISTRPGIQEKILNELEAIRVRTGKRIGDTYGIDELKDMNYLQAGIYESMRLFPPVPIDTKASVNEEIFPDGTFVGIGWMVICQTYAMGRMESIWGKDCEEFKPERWLENGVFKQESPFRYPVFHAGPRICLGKEMAIIQMKSIAASVIERFEFDAVCKDTCPNFVMALTLRMKGGLPVTMRVRKTTLPN
ncbi:cytochrome P450 CYP94D108-like [Humulus lupulus]|uniref:cytochrome P450 CYP94D108-like n=1 Tax=Humulus lupulus TaxID=3486 RepID=UPI002B413F8C|nr:cytochrome P450 CYP94D108-like [Humulus lupulus]